MSPEEHDIMRSVEDHYWWYQALRQHVAAAIEPVSSHFSLLDAGCGTGGMLSVLQQRFPAADLTGVDQSEHALELTATRKTGAKLIPASVNELPFSENSFHFVLSLDLISAVGVDEALAIHEARRVLRPGGRLILNVAALEFLRGAHDEAVDVDRRYTTRQVRALLEGANLHVETVTYWNAMLTPPIALLRWLSRGAARRDSVRSDFRSIPGPLNAILRQVALLELRVGHHLFLPFGTSVFAVARKNE